MGTVLYLVSNTQQSGRGAKRVGWGFERQSGGGRWGCRGRQARFLRVWHAGDGVLVLATGLACMQPAAEPRVCAPNTHGGPPRAWSPRDVRRAAEAAGRPQRTEQERIQAVQV